MPTSTPLTTVYCTDEHIAIEDPDDFATLCPASQCLARGTDGAISSASRWVLTSASFDFQSAGVTAGCVIILVLRGVFSPAGELFAVDSVSSGSVTLRRIGQLSGIGLPPGTASGLSGIEFAIMTYGAQIESESFALNREYSIDPAIPSRSPDSIQDLRDLREACVLQVLKGRYLYAMRMEVGDFALKYQSLKDSLSETKARLQVRWSPAISNDTPPPSTRFSTRLVR